MDIARTEAQRLTHELVICTKDRPDEVAQCLPAVAESSVMPRRIIVVDSSGDKRAREVVQRFVDIFAARGAELVYRHTSPGLPAQRNVGLSLATADILHFIDDDVLVSPEYFERILSTFEANPDAVGVGGHVVNPRSRRGGPSRMGRLFLLSPRPGHFNKAACNIPLRPDTQGTVDVGWLRGLAMSYRRPLASGLGFDDSLAGYALGEDMEFSVRIARHGRLLVDTSARVSHARSTSNRLNLSQYRRADIVNRWHFVATHKEFRAVAYWWSVIGLTLRALGMTARNPRGAGPQELKGIALGVLELASERSKVRPRPMVGAQRRNHWAPIMPMQRRVRSAPAERDDLKPEAAGAEGQP